MIRALMLQDPKWLRRHGLQLKPGEGAYQMTFPNEEALQAELANEGWLRALPWGDLIEHTNPDGSKAWSLGWECTPRV